MQCTGAACCMLTVSWYVRRSPSTSGSTVLSRMGVLCVVVAHLVGIFLTHEIDRGWTTQNLANIATINFDSVTFDYTMETAIADRHHAEVNRVEHVYLLYLFAFHSFVRRARAREPNAQPEWCARDVCIFVCMRNIFLCIVHAYCLSILFDLCALLRCISMCVKPSYTLLTYTHTCGTSRIVSTAANTAQPKPQHTRIAQYSAGTHRQRTNTLQFVRCFLVSSFRQNHISK